jgi:predicted acetyltransferase
VRSVELESPCVVLQLAAAADAPLLSNLLELYAHDLSDAFGLDVGPDGKFGYPQLGRYWDEPDQRFAFLIRVASQLAGFALVTRGSRASSDASALDVAEFFVLRRHRRIGVGSQAAARLWDGMPGHWIVRVAEVNRNALPFWKRVTSGYTQGRCAERQATIGGKAWTVFSFESNSPNRHAG